MKRKLMKFEDFQRIEKDSLSAAEKELREAEDVMARALSCGDLKLHCFGESNVTYRTLDGNYVYANYKLNKSHVIFEGIEELVIDEDTEKKQSKKLLGDFVENLLDNNDAKASQLFSQYMSLPVTRRTLKEATITEGAKYAVKKKTQKVKRRKALLENKGKFGNPKRWKVHARKLQKHKLHELAVLSENVMDYLDYQELGPALKRSSFVKTDDKGKCHGS